MTRNKKNRSNNNGTTIIENKAQQAKEEAKSQEIKEQLESKAEQRQTLFKKYQKLLFAYQETAEFKEPILQLMRRNNTVDFFENTTEGEFKYTHSDGTDRTIILTTKNLLSFPYGKKTFKGYVCHEDYPLPLPEDPIITTEQMQTVIDKALNDIKKWKAQEINAKTKMIWTIGLTICAVIGLYILFRIMVPTPPIQIINTPNGTYQVINETIKNLTGLTTTNLTLT